MAEPLYELTRVLKIYGTREVCSIDSLSIYRGEILGVMGPSGAGKSTLLRLLNFLEPVSQGTIRYKGWTANGAASLPLDVRRQVTTVFQEPHLLSTCVESNVALGLRWRQHKDILDKVRQTLERVGLRHLARASAPTLSVGEKQRVALARALVVGPEVLLLDEPTANLDPYNVALIESLVSSLNQEQGTTVVWVTHNVFQARRLCHRSLLLLEGHLVEEGPTEELFTHPRDSRTAAFIRGEMVY